MTIRHIAAATGTTTELVGRAYKSETGEKHPGFDTVLQNHQVEALLTRMGEARTQRPPERAAAAASLLAEFLAGKHQNGHFEGTQPLEVKPAQPARRAVLAKRETVKPANHAFTPAVKSRAWPTVTMLDVVYYTTIATAVYGLWFTLKEMGLAFAVPYTLVGLHALRMAKNPASRKTARAGLAAVVVLETLTFFVHLTLFNLRAVQAAKIGKLPLDYWDDPSAPWWIACVLAAMFSAAGVYAVAVTFSLTSEKHGAAEKAKQDADALRRRNAELERALRVSADAWEMVDGWNDVRRVTADRHAKEARETLESAT